MNPYDKAYELADSLRSSSQYTEMKQVRQRIEREPGTLQMLQDFRKRQWDIQSRQWMGQTVSLTEQEQFERLTEVVARNSNVSKYLELESYFQRLLMDVNEIVGRVISEVSYEIPLPDPDVESDVESDVDSQE
ncbi:YlbF family regulator [Alicyclobacillus mengziensis]|uniref:YlbF family regulator n=1 Tax=Alicyclobacillus mengziensis TaxID=2931921 RepID=A0A9X7VXA8_9BACL|nr:YlbF family regulator [Alicyclobacillus mengziensis]QSO46796.1 YlbF family regulator [Alicyclobacillus mengziensis]